MTLLHFAATVWGAVPSPTPTPVYDESLVTPGVIGFAITFLVAAVTIVLIIDMTRRVRRVRYRGELRERLAAEEASQTEAAATRPED